MPMTKLFSILSLIMLLIACKNNNQSVREPLHHSRQHVDMQSVNDNINLNKREEAYIDQMIQQDSLHSYINSGHGFWYYYVTRNKQNEYLPQEGDQVSLQYEIRDLSDNIIYSFDEIGTKTYRVDRENYFRGFREAVKLLHEGEEALFLFPSNAAYGYHGDEKKIGNNIPLKMRLRILKINQQKQ